jgi:hypothetical protein
MWHSVRRAIASSSCGKGHLTTTNPPHGLTVGSKREQAKPGLCCAQTEKEGLKGGLRVESFSITAHDSRRAAQ